MENVSIGLRAVLADGPGTCSYAFSWVPRSCTLAGLPSCTVEIQVFENWLRQGWSSFELNIDVIIFTVHLSRPNNYYCWSEPCKRRQALFKWMYSRSCPLTTYKSHGNRGVLIVIMWSIRYMCPHFMHEGQTVYRLAYIRPLGNAPKKRWNCLDLYNMSYS